MPLRQDEAASAERRQKRAIIEPIIAHPEGSPERREAKRIVLTTPVILNGQRTRLAESTVRRWLKEFEDGGEAALQRRARRDKGQAAVEITRRWDGIAAGLPAADRRRAALPGGATLAMSQASAASGPARSTRTASLAS